MKLTISQIAKMANVSRGTVDRVIHGRGSVSKETRQKIESIIEKYDYQPNAIGRALSQKRPYKIGVILIQEYNPFFNIIKKGVEDAIEQYQDYSIELVLKHLHGLNEEEYIKALDDMDGKVDAFAIIGHNKDAIINKVNEIVSHGTPLLTMNIDLFGSLRQGYIGINNYQGGQCMAGLVKDMAKGHTRILLMGGHYENKLESERIKGFLQVIQDFDYLQCSDVVYTQDDPKRVYDILKQELLLNSYEMVVTVGYGTHIICKVIDDLQLEKRPDVFGFDLLPENESYMRDGKISYIVDQCAYLQGKQTISYICEYFIHRIPLPQGNVFLPISIYNKYNI